MLSPIGKSVIPLDGRSRMRKERQKALLGQLDKGWIVFDESHMEREYHFSDFREAHLFVDKVAQVSQALGHHPVITLSWGKVKLTLSVPDEEGLSEMDFVLGIETDDQYRKYRSSVTSAAKEQIK